MVTINLQEFVEKELDKYFKPKSKIVKKKKEPAQSINLPDEVNKYFSIGFSKPKIKGKKVLPEGIVSCSFENFECLKNSSPLQRKVNLQIEEHARKGYLNEAEKIIKSIKTDQNVYYSGRNSLQENVDKQMEILEEKGVFSRDAFKKEYVSKKGPTLNLQESVDKQMEILEEKGVFSQDASKEGYNSQKENKIVFYNQIKESLLEYSDKIKATIKNCYSDMQYVLHGFRYNPYKNGCSTRLKSVLKH